MGRTRIAVTGAGLIGRAHIAIVARRLTCKRWAIVNSAPAARTGCVVELPAA